MTTLPEIPEPVSARLHEKLAARMARRPFYELVLLPGGSPVTRMWSSDLADVKRSVSTVRDDYLSEIGNRGLAELSDSGSQGGPRSELLHDVIWAPDGKRGMHQLKKIAGDESRHLVIRRVAGEILTAREQWQPVRERLALAAEVLITRAAAAAQKEADAIAAVPKHRLDARPKVERMVVESCKSGMDEWEADFVPAQVKRILYHAIKYEECEAGNPSAYVGVDAYCEAASGSARWPERSTMWWNAKREASLIKQELTQLLPVESVGRARAEQSARDIARHLREQFLGKMVEKLCSAECEDRVASIETLRERVAQGRLAATLIVRLADGGRFHLETNSVIKYGPRSGQPFAQWPTRFTKVKPAGVDEPLAMVAEADVAAVLAAPAAETADDAVMQKNKATKR